jgi:predicted transcriptional regulator
MKYQNVTLSLPRDLLLKVKHIAIDRNTSLSGLLAQTLEEIVTKHNEYEKARQQHLKIMEEGIDFKTDGEITWKRDDLHER